MKLPKIVALAFCSLLLLSCGGNKKPSAAKTEHEQWLLSLNDSVAALRDSIALANEEIESLKQDVSQRLESFTYVNNPRQVEGYTILNGWEKRYPLTSTGIIARMTESEELELVAALTGLPFEAISVTSDGETVTSATVPHDQALNYRANGLTTVAFTGPKADSIAALIAKKPESTAKLTFLNPNPVKSVNIDAATCSMIAKTWTLISQHRKLNALERKLPLLDQKIKIYEAKATQVSDSQTQSDKDK